MADAHNSRFLHSCVSHERVLQVHRADPFAAGLDHVLAAVYQPNAAIKIDGGDVAGPEPSVFTPAILRSGRVEVAGCYPWAADLQLAHAVAVPWCFPLLVNDSDINQGRRPALLTP